MGEREIAEDQPDQWRPFGWRKQTVNDRGVEQIILPEYLVSNDGSVQKLVR
jgi:hypothetical protein